MGLRRKIKKNAVSALSGRWVQAVCASLIILCLMALFIMVEALTGQLLGASGYVEADISLSPYVSNVPDTSSTALALTATFAVAAYLLAIPIEMGLFRFGFQTASAKPARIGSLFYYFRGPGLYLKSLMLRTHIISRSILWTALCCAPGAALVYFDLTVLKVYTSVSQEQYTGQFTAIILLWIGGILIFLGIILGIVLSGRYFAAPYLLIEQPDMGILQAIKISVRYTKSRRGDIFLFRLSFLPWLVSCIALIPALYVVPYYSTARSLYAKYVIEYNRYYEVHPVR